MAKDGGRRAGSSGNGGGQGWGNDGWLRHVGSCPGWRHRSHPSPSPEMSDLGTQPPGSSHRRINCALIYSQRCLCGEGAGTPTARVGAPPSPSTPSTRVPAGTSPRGNSNGTSRGQTGLPLGRQEVPSQGHTMFAQARAGEGQINFKLE